MPERSVEGCQARPGGFAPLGEVGDLAALYRSRQARYPRAKADRELARRRDHVELDPAIDASGSALSSGARRRCGATFSAPGASLITAADSLIQPDFLVALPFLTTCRGFGTPYHLSRT